MSYRDLRERIFLLSKILLILVTSNHPSLLYLLSILSTNYLLLTLCSLITTINSYYIPLKFLFEGKTMVELLAKISEYKPRSVKVVSLLLKTTSRSNSYLPDYVGFSIPDLFVVGYCVLIIIRYTFIYIYIYLLWS